jgi:hypothetical protein
MSLLVTERCASHLTIPIYVDSYYITGPEATNGGPKATVQIKPNKNLWPSITYLKYNVYFVRNDAPETWRDVRPLQKDRLKVARDKTEMFLRELLLAENESMLICAAEMVQECKDRSVRILVSGSFQFHVEFVFLSLCSNCVSFCLPFPLCVWHRHIHTAAK